MKRQNFRASPGGVNRIQTKIKSRARFNKSSTFSNNLMKRQNFRAGGGGGGIHSDKGPDKG